MTHDQEIKKNSTEWQVSYALSNAWTEESIKWISSLFYGKKIPGEG